MESSRPSSPKRSPSALPCEPIRCSADTPFGDVYSTRIDASRRITPSPTRGASSVSMSWASNGKAPAAIMRAKRLKMST